jgi:hypothetical protein
MKKIILVITLVLGCTALSGYGHTLTDTITLKTDSDNNVYYQKTVNIAGNTNVELMYDRLLQFMATKNFTQTYGDDQKWKFIFTTTQDLNINRARVGDDDDPIIPYTVQFAITVDLRNGRYRYTVNNALFFIPTVTYNKRETLYDIYVKANNNYDKRVAKDANALLASFERYLEQTTNELHQKIEQRSAMYNSNF